MHIAEPSRNVESDQLHLRNGRVGSQNPDFDEEIGVDYNISKTLGQHIPALNAKNAKKSKAFAGARPSIFLR
jgi:hypothetical protein